MNGVNGIFNLCLRGHETNIMGKNKSERRECEWMGGNLTMMEQRSMWILAWIVFFPFVYFPFTLYHFLLHMPYPTTFCFSINYQNIMYQKPYLFFCLEMILFQRTCLPSIVNKFKSLDRFTCKFIIHLIYQGPI